MSIYSSVKYTKNSMKNFQFFFFFECPGFEFRQNGHLNAGLCTEKGKVYD